MEPSQTNPFPKPDTNGNLIRGNMEQAAERIKVTTAQVINRTVNATVPALDEMVTKREQLRASQQRLMSSAAECMHSYPLAMIGLAFGADFLISRLLRCNND